METLTQYATTPFGRLVLRDQVGNVNLRRLLGEASYAPKLSDIDFALTVGSDLSDVVPRSYRQRQFQMGHYLGHHSGLQGALAVQDSQIFMTLKEASPGDYERVIWQYCVKFYLSFMSFALGAVHVKCVSLFDNCGGAVLLFGRGGSGKSTLGGFLSENGLIFAGNTHAIISQGHVWALNTWRRVRTVGRDVYELPAHHPRVLQGEIKKLFIVGHNQTGEHSIRSLDTRQARAYLETFGLATTAYDLKEDLYEACGEQSFLGGLSRERDQLRKLIQRLGVRLVDSDLRENHVQLAVKAEILENLCV